MNTRNRHFPLFQSHLDFAHAHWSRLIVPGDIVVDATLGNGHDAVVLSGMVGEGGLVYGLDVQEAAVESALCRLEGAGCGNARLFCQSHETFPDEIVRGSVKLVVYNLGYLPGGDKSVTTKLSTTLASVQNALELLCPGGAVCITCYPGHEEGAREEKCLADWACGLDPSVWCVSSLCFLNRKRSPSLLLIQKSTI